MSEHEKLYTIKKTADLAGTTVKALRYYEKIGLLAPSVRSEAGYRLYSEDDLSKLTTILFYKKLEFPLKELAQILRDNSPGRARAIARHAEMLQGKSFRYQALVELAKGTLQTDEHPEPDQSNSDMALLIQCVQYDFVDWLDDPDMAKRIIDNIARISDAMRESGRPVIYVSDCHSAEELTEFPLWGKHAVIGTHGAEILPELAPHAADYLIYKRSYSAFEGTELKKLLDRLHVTKLMLVGMLTNIGVQHTCADAFRYNYEMILPLNSTATVRSSDLTFSLQQLRDAFGAKLMPVDDVIEMLRNPAEVQGETRDV